jgi:hypothetical protein
MSANNLVGQWAALGTIGLIGVGTLLFGIFYPELIITDSTPTFNEEQTLDEPTNVHQFNNDENNDILVPQLVDLSANITVEPMVTIEELPQIVDTPTTLTIINEQSSDDNKKHKKNKTKSKKDEKPHKKSRTNKIEINPTLIINDPPPL